MIEYKIVRMKRKTLSLSVSDDLVVIVKAPRFVLKSTIDAFVRKNEKWIEEAIIRKIILTAMKTAVITPFSVILRPRNKGISQSPPAT